MQAATTSAWLSNCKQSLAVSGAYFCAVVFVTREGQRLTVSRGTKVRYSGGQRAPPGFSGSICERCSIALKQNLYASETEQ